MGKKEWPIYGIIRNPPVKDQPLFRIQSRNLYVDVPNNIILDFITHLMVIAEEMKEEDEEKIREEFRKFAGKVNDFLSKNIPWMKFVIRKETSGSVRIGVQIRIDWKKFEEFLRDFPSNNKFSLTEKYEYLFACKRAGLIIALRDRESRIEDTQKRVREIVEEDITNTMESLDSLCQHISEYKNTLLRGARRKKLGILTLEYLPEMYSTVTSLKTIVSDGVVTPCYRELRKILGNLCWAIFNDILYQRSVSRARSVNFTPLYTVISQEWFLKSRGKGHTLKDLGDLRRCMKDMTDKLEFYSKIKGYGWSKKSIRKTILDTIDYSLIIVLTGRERREYDKDERIPFVKAEQLKPLTVRSIEMVISSLKNKRLSKSDRRLAVELSEGVIGDKKELVPAFPSDKFVMKFVGRIAGVNLYELYRNYSVFVHSYPFSWQTFPYSSVLEYRILLHEVNRFRDAIVQMLDRIHELKL